MAAKVSSHILTAQPRKILGRKVKQLRRDGILPANIYGKKIKSESVQVKTAEFLKTFEQTGETGLVTLKVGEKEHPVLIQNLQVNAYTEAPLHVDFLEVDLREKVTATVQIEFIGESPVEKSQEGIVVPQLREVEVEALPMDLPENIVVDISELDAVGKTIKVADLKVDRSKVEIKGDSEQIVVTVEEPAKEEEPVVAAPAEGEEGATPTEGETPVEGAEVPAEGKQPADNPPTGGKKEE